MDIDPNQLNLANFLMGMTSNDPNNLGNLFSNPALIAEFARQQQQAGQIPQMPQALLNSMLPNLNLAQFQNMPYGRPQPPSMMCRICNKESTNAIEFHENGTPFYVCSGSSCMERHNYQEYKKKMANGDPMPGILNTPAIQEDLRRGPIGPSGPVYGSQRHQAPVSQNQNIHNNNTSSYNQHPNATNGGGGNPTISTGTFYPPQMLNTNNNNSELNPQMKKNMMSTPAPSSKSRRVNKPPQKNRRAAPYQMNKQQQQQQRAATPPSNNKLNSSTTNYQQQAPPQPSYYQQQQTPQKQRQPPQLSATPQQQKRHPPTQQYPYQQQQPQLQHNGNYRGAPQMTTTTQQRPQAASSKSLKLSPTNQSTVVQNSRMIPVGFTSDREYCEKFLRPLLSKFNSHELSLLRKELDEIQIGVKGSANNNTMIYNNTPLAPASKATTSNGAYVAGYPQQTNGGYQNKSSLIPPAPVSRDLTFRGNTLNPFKAGTQPPPTSNGEPILNSNNPPANYRIQQDPECPEISRDVPAHSLQIIPMDVGQTNGTSNGMPPASTNGPSTTNGTTSHDGNKSRQYKFHESYASQQTDRQQTAPQFQLAKAEPNDQVHAQTNGTQVNGTSSGEGSNGNELQGGGEAQRSIKTEVKENDNNNQNCMQTSGESYMMNGGDTSIVTNPAYKSPPASTEMDLSSSSTKEKRQASPFRANENYAHSSGGNTPRDSSVKSLSTAASNDEEEEEEEEGDLVIDLSACK